MTNEEQKRLKELTIKMKGEFDISGKELKEYLELNIKKFHCGADKPCPVDNCEDCPNKNKIYYEWKNEPEEEVKNERICYLGC